MAQSRERRFLAFGLTAGAFFLLSCAPQQPELVPIAAAPRQPPLAEVAELEVRAYGADRFVSCPPPGELGEPWFPDPPRWSPASPSTPTSKQTPSSTDAGATEPADSEYVAYAAGRSLTELAVAATERDFKSCYRRGLRHDSHVDGRVAIVLRIGTDGRVARTEEYAACGLAAESVLCMKDVAKRLRFPPPASGSETVIVPTVYTSRDGVRRTAGSTNDSYTARSYITLEAARPGLHACEERARRERGAPHATATFILTLGTDGKVVRTHVDPWSGEQSLLECAARELEKLEFPDPPSGSGTVVARLNFNPSQASR